MRCDVLGNDFLGPTHPILGRKGPVIDAPHRTPHRFLQRALRMRTPTNFHMPPTSATPEKATSSIGSVVTDDAPTPTSHTRARACGALSPPSAYHGRSALMRYIRIGLAFTSSLPLSAGAVVVAFVLSFSLSLVVGICGVLATALLSGLLFCAICVGAALCGVTSILLGCISLILLTAAALSPVAALWGVLLSTAPEAKETDDTSSCGTTISSVRRAILG